MIRTLAAALAAFVLVSFSARADDAKPAEGEKKPAKKGKKAKKAEKKEAPKAEEKKK